MLLPFSSYQLESTASSQRLVNCYAEKTPEGAKGPLILRRAPGIEPFAAPGGIGRGLCAMSGVLYSISGTTLYRIDQDATVTGLGTVSGTAPVSMAASATQLYIDSGFVYDGSLNALTDPDYIADGKAAFLDSYIVTVRPDTGQFASSDLADFTSWDALYFATAEGSPDNLLTLEVDHRQVVLIGENSTELWEDVGGTDFPFIRSPNGFIEIGGVGKLASTKQDQSVHWLANDRTLRRLNGNTATRTSQHGFERAVRDYASVTDCQMYSYNLDGHLCVVIRFPDVATWIYDCTTQEIHERQSYGREDWDVSGFAECYGKVFVQRASDGAIGVLTKGIYQEFGNDLVSSWTYQNVYGQGQRLTIDHLELGVETGVGLTGELPPSISLEVSYDGGRTYKSLPTKSLGALGDYRSRVIWDRLGSGYNMVIRMSMSDPVPLTIWDTQVAVR